MKRAVPHVIGSFLGIFLSIAGCVAWGGAAAAEPEAGGSPDVLTIRISTNGAGYWGGEPVGQDGLTNRIARLDPDYDLLVVQGPENDTTGGATRKVVEQLLHLSKPLLLVEPDGSITAEAREEAAGRPAFSLSSEQLGRVLNPHQRTVDGAGHAGSRPVLRVRLEEDPALESYYMEKMELGVLGRKIWLIHEGRPDEEETTGIQLKRLW